jgi:hypothetical protein
LPLERIEHRQLVPVGIEPIGEGEEHGLPLGGGAARPAAVIERAASRPDRQVDVGGIARGDLGKRLPRGRVLRREPRPALGRSEGAVDERIGPERWLGRDHHLVLLYPDKRLDHRCHTTS